MRPVIQLSPCPCKICTWICRSWIWSWKLSLALSRTLLLSIPPPHFCSLSLALSSSRVHALSFARSLALACSLSLSRSLALARALGLLSHAHKCVFALTNSPNALIHTATHCNSATHCNTLQHTATHCNTLHHMCSPTHLQRTHTIADTEMSVERCMWCSVLQRVGVLQMSVCCSGLQCVVVCCSVLQCVAVCCSVLQCVVVCYRYADTEMSAICSTLHHTAPHYTTCPHEREIREKERTLCNTLQPTATRCNTLQHAATHVCLRERVHSLQHTATHSAWETDERERAHSLQHTHLQIQRYLRSSEHASPALVSYNGPYVLCQLQRALYP